MTETIVDTHCSNFIIISAIILVFDYCGFYGKNAFKKYGLCRFVYLCHDDDDGKHLHVLPAKVTNT